MQEKPANDRPSRPVTELSRRSFLGATAGLAIGPGFCVSGANAAPALQERFRGGTYRGPIAIATWPHGLPAVEVAHGVMASGGGPLDAVERGINLVEEDPAVSSVGVGGLPNQEGVVELDAAIMDGKGLRCGSVMSLRDISRPISVARRVFETTRHVQLVGEGAHRFALAEGFAEVELLTETARGAWERWRDSPERVVPGQVPDGSTRDGEEEPHDTIGMVALDATGHLVAGCSTSGLAWKLPGRVGDSPVVGAGLYCDGEVGGASATGIGEEVIRVCGSFLIVEEMRRGASPQEAVEEALRRVVRTDPRNRLRQVAFIALSRSGAVGAGSIRPGFTIALRSAEGARLLPTWSLEGE